MNRRTKKKTRRPLSLSDLTAADRAVEEIREVRRKLWQDAGGTYEGVVEIGRKEGVLPSKGAPKRRRTA